MRGAGDRKGKLPVEAYVGEEINQFEQAFGNEAANNANQQRITRDFNDFGLQGYAEVAFPGSFDLGRSRFRGVESQPSESSYGIFNGTTLVSECVDREKARDRSASRRAGCNLRICRKRNQIVSSADSNACSPRAFNASRISVLVTMPSNFCSPKYHQKHGLRPLAQ